MKQNDNQSKQPYDRSLVLRYGILLILTITTGLHMFLGIDIPAHRHIEHLWYCVLTIIVLISTQDWWLNVSYSIDSNESNSRSPVGLYRNSPVDQLNINSISNILSNQTSGLSTNSTAELGSLLPRIWNAVTSSIPDTPLYRISNSRPNETQYRSHTRFIQITW